MNRYRRSRDPLGLIRVITRAGCYYTASRTEAKALAKQQDRLQDCLVHVVAVSGRVLYSTRKAAPKRPAHYYPF
jgi:hypothetical protein